MLTIFTVFPPERRGSAMGLFGLGVVLAPAFGPSLGGWAVDTFGWRYVFFLPLPLTGLALLLGSIFMPTRGPDQRPHAFDWLGFLLLCTALVCLLNGFASGQREGWHSDIIVLQLAGGAAAVLGFVMMSDADPNTPFWTFVGFTLVNRFGLAMTMTPLNTGALRALRPDQVSQGSGAINFCRMLGGACGVNLLVVWLEMRIRLYSDALTATQTLGNESSRELLRAVESILAVSGVPEAQQGPGALHYLGQMVYAQASMLGFQETFLAAAFIAFAALLPAWIMGRARRPAMRLAPIAR
jgi:hypothetical protein